MTTKRHPRRIKPYTKIEIKERRAYMNKGLQTRTKTRKIGSIIHVHGRLKRKLGAALGNY